MEPELVPVAKKRAAPRKTLMLGEKVGLTKETQAVEPKGKRVKASSVPPAAVAPAPAPKAAAKAAAKGKKKMNIGIQIEPSAAPRRGRAAAVGPATKRADDVENVVKGIVADLPKPAPRQRASTVQPWRKAVRAVRA